MVKHIGRAAARWCGFGRSLVGVGTCALSLTGILGAPALAQNSGGAPASAIAGAKAKIDQEIAKTSAMIEAETARLETFVDKATVAKDKSMDIAGIEAKAKLDREIVRLLGAARGAIPKDGSFEPGTGSANECRQANGADVVKKGTATCVSSAGNGGRATARGQGERSTATAKAGDAGRTGQGGNVADAVSTGGANATANAGVGDHDQENKSTAVAGGAGSLATADTISGDRNVAFAGSVNKGEARASSRAGDRNIAIALGANGSNDENGPGGSRATTLIGFDNIAVSLTSGANSSATTNAGYGDRHRAIATAGPNAHARADGAQGEDNNAFSEAVDRGHALSYTSYGDKLLAISKANGDGSTGPCAPIGRPQSSGETNYPPDACATANARAVDGQSNTAISIVNKAKAYSVAERGVRNTAVTRASNGGDIIWNTTPSVTQVPANQPPGPFQMTPQAPNPHAGMKADCPWPLPPLPQAQQACGNATAKASYGDGNLAVAAPNGDHSFAWSEASGGSYNQTYVVATGAGPQARARAIYTTYSTAKATAKDGGKADAFAVMGYQNVAVANATGKGSVANASAAGPHARATAAATAGGTATAVHNTATSAGFLGTDLNTKVSCSNESVAYAMIGTGQSCGKGF